MTRADFIDLLNAYSVKCVTAAVGVISKENTTMNVNDELIRMWQQISEAVAEHWCETDTPPHPPSGGTLFP